MKEPLKALPLWIAAAFLSIRCLGQSAATSAELARAAASEEKAGHYEQAAGLYKQILDSSGSDPALALPVRTRLATAYFLLHRYQDSLDAVAPITSGGPQDAATPAQAWLVRGLDYLELQRLSEAAGALRRA